MTSTPTPTAGILTLGCKVNQYESEAIAEALSEKGVRILPHTQVCDLYIINTCTVTAESDRKARQFIRRAIAKNPAAYVLVTGCLAQTAPDSVAALPGVDAVIGNSEKLAVVPKALALLKSGQKMATPFRAVAPIEEAAFEPMRITRFDRTRAYVKIEDGCENKCTYCIIPYARGRVRSKSAEDVLREVTALTEGGCREVVLTGIETASWGKDLSPREDLASLLCRVDAIPNIGRVRLGSLDPSLIRPELAERLAGLSCLAPHFHLSLQSGSSRVLAAMKRKYNADMAMSAIELLRQHLPNVKFTTDVIVGFPGETEAEFEETVDFVRRARFLQVHIFPYSKRAGTPAATMSGQIAGEEKSRRLHRLSEVCTEIRAELLAEAVAEHPLTEVLFETYENGLAVGHTADFLEVEVPSERPLHAELFPVRLTSSDGNRCRGTLLADCPQEERATEDKTDKKV